MGDLVRYVDVLKPDDVLTVRISDRANDLANGVISNNTPLAQVLLGALVGDEVQLHLPGGTCRLISTQRLIIISSRASGGKIRPRLCRVMSQANRGPAGSASSRCRSRRPGLRPSRRPGRAAACYPNGWQETAVRHLAGGIGDEPDERRRHDFRLDHPGPIEARAVGDHRRVGDPARNQNVDGHVAAVEDLCHNCAERFERGLGWAVGRRWFVERGAPLG